ncbi:MAG TPA: NYN domain-containing protein [Solirubrobacteraceae bacterium]|nr:NYN domain-containing protein [Solirubrobacteraceae bacterium]
MPLIVDGNNVMGARPDGWWRDRAGAAARLAREIGAWAQAEGQDVVVVFDGRRPDGFPAPPGVDVRFAARSGRDAADDVIATLVAAAEAPDALRVVTSDAALAARVRAHGATVTGAGGFRDALERRADDAGA